jgi:hypothetical protein
MTHRNHYPPDEPSDKPMTPAQIELLRRVVRTNGGGVNARGENARVVQGLMDRHMVQGKSGDLSCMIHTRRGLDWVRANPLNAVV